MQSHVAIECITVQIVQNVEMGFLKPCFVKVTEGEMSAHLHKSIHPILVSRPGQHTLALTCLPSHRLHHGTFAEKTHSVAD